MKTILILLLLIPMLCYGIEYDESQSLIMPAPEWKAYFNLDNRIIQHRDEETEILTIAYILELYDEYADSCYADSTQKSGWVFVEMEKCGNGIIGGYDEYQTWYEHKQPTFEGFIEFLRSKNEKH